MPKYMGANEPGYVYIVKINLRSEFSSGMAIQDAAYEADEQADS